MDTFIRILWAGVALLALTGVITGIGLLSEAETVLQEISALGYSIAIAGIPYVIVRAIEKFLKN